MRFVLLGGLGQVGLPTARALAATTGAEVVVADARTPDPQLRATLADEGVDVAAIRIPDDDGLRRLLATGDRVLLAAAQLTSGFEKDAAAATRLNVQGAESVFRVAREMDVARVVLSSSIAVYGGDLQGHITEDSPAKLEEMSDANRCYATSKLLAESLGRLHFANTDSEFVALRYSAIYGPSPDGAGATSIRLRRAVIDAAHHGQPADSSTFGWTDLIHVDDVVNANVAALTTSSCAGNITIATGVTCGPQDVVAAVAAATGLERLDVPPGAATSASPPFTFDVGLASQVLDWHARITLEQGVAASAPAWLADPR